MKGQPYNLEYADEVIDVWFGVFEALSIRQFGIYGKFLGFPYTDPPEDLRQLAKDFMLTCCAYLGGQIPELPSIRLHDGAYDADPLVVIWQNAMAHLEELGYAEEVYNWGRRTYRYLEKGKSYIPIGTDWDYLLIDWANMTDRFPPVDLGERTILKLQLVLVKVEAKTWRIRSLSDWVRQSTKTPYEEYALKTMGIESWMVNQANFQARLEKWHAVFDLLTEDELAILEAWGTAHLKRMRFKEVTLLVPPPSRPQKW